MTKSLLKQLIVVTALLTAQAAHSAGQCFDAFNLRSPVEDSSARKEVPYSYNIETGQVYKFHLRDQNEVLVGLLTKSSMDGDTPLYTFEVEGRTYEFKSTDILGIRAEETPQTSWVERFIEAPIKEFLVMRKLSKLIFKPYRTLAPATKRLEVLGAWTASKETGVMLSKELTGFDAHMENLGFEIPAITRLIVSDRPILPDMAGPVSVQLPLVNIWRGVKPKRSIMMSAALYRTSLAKSLSVLFHERMHSILHATFQPTSFVNKAMSLQEALADYGSALYGESPEIGSAPGEKPLRNIETRRSDFFRSSEVRHAVLDAEGATYHDDSMLISNVFWNLRNAIGTEEARSQLLPMIMGFNLYHPKFQQFIRASKLESQEEITTFAQDLDFIFASMLKSSQLIANLDVRVKARASILKSAKNLNYSTDRILNIEQFLEATPQAAEKPDQSKSMVSGIVLTTYGVFGLAADASFTYWVSGLVGGLFN